MSALRLFFALWPGERMQSELAEAVAPAMRAAGGRPIPQANLHATLAFLGSVPESRLADLISIADGVAASWRRSGARIVMRLDGTEHWVKPAILCARASVTPQSATDLARELKDALVAGGFAPDLKPFHSHVTVARKVARVSDSALTPVEWSFDSFALVASTTHPSGSSYSVRKSWLLVETHFR